MIYTFQSSKFNTLLTLQFHYPAKRNEHSLNQDVLSEYHDKQLSFATNQYQPYTSQNQDSPHKFVKKFLDHDDVILLYLFFGTRVFECEFIVVRSK